MPTNLNARSVARLKPGAKPRYVTDALIAGLAVRVALDGSGIVFDGFFVLLMRRRCSNGGSRRGRTRRAFGAPRRGHRKANQE